MKHYTVKTDIMYFLLSKFISLKLCDEKLDISQSKNKYTSYIYFKQLYFPFVLML